MGSSQLQIYYYLKEFFSKSIYKKIGKPKIKIQNKETLKLIIIKLTNINIVIIVDAINCNTASIETLVPSILLFNAETKTELF